jgi:hypothetical protein
MTANETHDPAGGPSARYEEAAAADASLLARHAELVAVDNVIGLEATVARLDYDLKRARERVRRLKAQLAERDAEIAALRGSRTWRIGRLLTAPFSRMRG